MIICKIFYCEHDFSVIIFLFFPLYQLRPFIICIYNLNMYIYTFQVHFVSLTHILKLAIWERKRSALKTRNEDVCVEFFKGPYTFDQKVIHR